MDVYKRNGVKQGFEEIKIFNAINKANKSVDEAERMSEEELKKVLETILKMLKGFNVISVEDIQDIVEKALMKHNKYAVAKSYILYREDKKKLKKFSSLEEQAFSLVEGTNEFLRGDNANKQVDIASSQRDYLAGLVCKSYFKKTAPKEVVKAHTNKLIHFHDADYAPLMPLFNCDLLNIKDMFENNFQIGGAKIETPKTFHTAANLLAQISLVVSGSQYGGQTISWAHLIPFVGRTRKYYNDLIEEAFNYLHLPKLLRKLVNPFRKAIVEFCTQLNITIGIKTYQYQIICHQSSNGQTPFVSNNLCLREVEKPEDLKDFATIIEKILKRRLKGVKDSKNEWVGPLFPKLLYWLCDGLNVKPSDPYFYLTELAAECNAVRLQPDINSEKIGRNIKKGQIIPSMGCRSWLSPIWEETKVPVNTKFNWQYITPQNVYYEGAPGVNFNYSSLNFYKEIPTTENLSNIVINFAGNSGWIKSIETVNGVECYKILKPFIYGRFNSGVVTVNIPHAALAAKEEYNKLHQENSNINLIDIFYNKLTEYFEIARKGLIYRTERVKNIKAKNIPIHLMHGAIARMNPEDTIRNWVNEHPTAMSTSFGFIGLFETCQVLIGKSNTTKEGQKICVEILQFINNLISKWSEEDKLNYSLYGTPEESLTRDAATALRRDFGFIEKVTDKDYVVNSYHVDPREEINWDKKLEIESKYLSLVSGGAVSYIETPDMRKNTKALVTIIQYMYEVIAYAEINRKVGKCYTCGFDGEIPLIKTEQGKFKFKCPCCGETKDENMNVTARLCGYLGQVNAGNTNQGRLDDIYSRVYHIK